jgi:DNA-directed RNA polymerase subunit RPC12/RpoP
MQVNFKCPHCQASLQVGSDLAGESGVCPYCSKKITVPEQDASRRSDEKEAARTE